RLAMPLTMMNESGRALHALRADAKALLIVCDDVNLPLGTLRFRPSGGPGGHHGLASCLDVLGTDDVARLRLGVGIDPLPKDLREFVLSPYRPEERPVVEAMYAQAADACEVWIQEGLNAAMNRYNTAREA
ncbi:MAG TPA: aminoacyl-tRNA hydrolase, partial [bacterium]